MNAFSESSCASITCRDDSTSATGESSPDPRGPARSAIVQELGSAGTGGLRRGPRHRDLAVTEQLLVDSLTELLDVGPVLRQRRAVLLGYIEAAASDQVVDVRFLIGRTVRRAWGRRGSPVLIGHSVSPVAPRAFMAAVFDRRYRK